MQDKRARKINDVPLKEHNTKPVLYWMSREQRIDDNWGLLYARQAALKSDAGLIIVFCLSDKFLNAQNRHYYFMIDNLQKCIKKSLKKNIPFYLLCGNPEEEILRMVKKADAGMLVTDFDPLKIKTAWKKNIAKSMTDLNVPFFEVDSHNIIPAWVVSQKKEWGAYTLRPKIRKMIGNYTEDYPGLAVMPEENISVEIKNPEMKDCFDFLNLTVPKRPFHFESGEEKALKILFHFMDKKLLSYDKDKNDPLKDALSGLSPYLHFGQISSLRVLLEINKRFESYNTGIESFLEEIIVRKELSDNFCLYEKNYDSPEGFPEWGLKTLLMHENDKRNYIYEADELESAQTHDFLWNAAQKEMMLTGKMHGYMRMYWAKKILEWSTDSYSAQKNAIYLNDKYSLDGRDPSGYTGIAWSVGGVHDRPWKEREIFGKIRYMSYSGAVSKFDVKAYMEKINNIASI